MARKYKYYCRKCKRVTDWTISESRQGVERHTCYICKTTAMFADSPIQTVRHYCEVCGKITFHIVEE